MNSIQNEQPLKLTCGVCGKPLSNLSMIPLVGDLVKNQCKLCNQSICDAHFSKSKQSCSKCVKGTDSWCSTPKLPKL